MNPSEQSRKAQKDSLWLSLFGLVLLLQLSLALLFIMGSPFYISNVSEETHPFSLSLMALKNWKLWTLLSWFLIPRHFLWAVLNIFVAATLYPGFKESNYSSRQLAGYWLLAGLSGGLFHVALAPDHYAIQGSYGLALGILVLRLWDMKNVVFFTLKDKSLTGNSILCLVLFLDLCVMAFIGNSMQSSFVSHLGILLFTWYWKRWIVLREPPQPFVPKVQPVPLQKRAPEKKAQPSGSQEEMEVEINRILDKISSNGMDSLNEQEVKTLKKASHQWKKQD